MPERWVVNASPVILLAKAGVIHLLPSLCDELAIPAGVVAEVVYAQTDDMTIPVTVQLPEETAKAIDVRPEQLPHEVRAPPKSARISNESANLIVGSIAGEN